MGRAWASFGGTVNRNAFLAPDSLVEARCEDRTRIAAHGVTFVSNRGGVETGNRYTDRVATHICEVIGPLSAAGTAVETPKKDVLAAAKITGDSLGALFLFSIIAGVLLLVNIFVMPGEERKSPLLAGHAARGGDEATRRRAQRLATVQNGQCLQASLAFAPACLCRS